MCAGLARHSRQQPTAGHQDCGPSLIRRLTSAQTGPICAHQRAAVTRRPTTQIGPARGAILQPPKPEIRPSPHVLQRAADRDADPEAAD